MSTDFDHLIASIELEARQEGPGAVRELAQFREELGSASRTILRQRGGYAHYAPSEHEVQMVNEAFASRPEAEPERDPAGS